MADKPTEYTLVLTPDEAMLISALAIVASGGLHPLQAQLYFFKMSREAQTQFLTKIETISSQVVGDGHVHGE